MGNSAQADCDPKGVYSDHKFLQNHRTSGLPTRTSLVVQASEPRRRICTTQEIIPTNFLWHVSMREARATKDGVATWRGTPVNSQGQRIASGISHAANVPDWGFRKIWYEAEHWCLNMSGFWTSVYRDDDESRTCSQNCPLQLVAHQL